MDRFNEVAKIVLGYEGGLSDHPADKGGRTNLGITQSTLNNARKTIPSLPLKVDDLTPEQALLIYKTFYWNLSKCDSLPKDIDLLVFDCSIHSGVSASIKQLQRALNKLNFKLAVDGVIGAFTINAAKSSNKVLLTYILSLERIRYLNDIITRDKTQLVMINGWLNRVFKNIDSLV